MNKFINSAKALTAAAAIFISAAVSTYAADSLKFTDKNDMSFQMRGSLRTEIPQGGEASAKFRMDNFRWNVQGTFGKKDEFFYHFRWNLATNFTKNPLDNFLSSVDYAYVTWRAAEKFSLTMGKQVFALGGEEFWAAPVYVLQFSDFGGSIACYQLGVKGTWHISPTQELSLQMANIRGNWDKDYYVGGLPEGVESTNAPFLYTLNWTGQFLDNNALAFRYSASYGQQAKGKDWWIFTMGQSYKSEKIGGYLDLAYSRQGLDANGLISGVANIKDPLTGMPVSRTIENVDYTAVIAYLNFSISPSFSAFVKGSWELGMLNKPYTVDSEAGITAKAGICRRSWNGQAALQYMPTKNKDFRFFLHYNFYNLQATGNGRILGINNYLEHRISLGLIYVLNVY